jgi:carotenoid 1,2-hydratase
VGSVFSPFYAKARKAGAANPEDHCAINVALYGKHKRWVMTERGAKQMEREADAFRLGPSSLLWKDGSLIIHINEKTSPFAATLKGRVVLTPECFYDHPIALDAAEKHHWQAVAPRGRIEVTFENPAVSWAGQAYHDMNWGSEALEKAFTSWTWSRAQAQSGTHVFYDLKRRDGTVLTFGRTYTKGDVQEISLPNKHTLSKSYWALSREVYSDRRPKLLDSLEDTPFYNRSGVEVSINGEACEGFHETLSLQRFTKPIVQWMIPYRMRREV